MISGCANVVLEVVVLLVVVLVVAVVDVDDELDETVVVEPVALTSTLMLSMPVYVSDAVSPVLRMRRYVGIVVLTECMRCAHPLVDTVNESKSIQSLALLDLCRTAKLEPPEMTSCRVQKETETTPPANEGD